MEEKEDICVSLSIYLCGVCKHHLYTANAAPSPPPHNHHFRDYQEIGQTVFLSLSLLSLRFFFCESETDSLTVCVCVLTVRNEAAETQTGDKEENRTRAQSSERKRRQILFDCRRRRRLWFAFCIH